MAKQTENATHVYVKVANPKSLCPKFEGPFAIESRPSRSQVKVRVGSYANGEPRFLTLHWSSCKIAHVRQNFQEGSRPNIGRKKRDGPDPTVVQTQLTPNNFQNDATDLSDRLSTNKPVDTVDTQRGKIQTAFSNSPRPTPADSVADDTAYETMSGKRPHPAYLEKGPVITREAFDKWSPEVFRAAGSPDFTRPQRSTRNPSPKYKD